MTSRPWEGRWTVERETRDILGVRCEPALLVRVEDDGERPVVAEVYASEAHAMLIAATPEIARVLLAVEWSGEAGGHYQVCPSCGECGGESCAASHPPEPHAIDCALASALRKSGVRT